MRSLSIHARRFLEDALVELECFVPDGDADLVEEYRKTKNHPTETAVALSDQDTKRAEAALKAIRHGQAQALAWLRGEDSPDATDEAVLEGEPVLVGSAHKSITRVLLHGELAAAELLAIIIWIPVWLVRAATETQGFPSKRESLEAWVLGAGAFAAAPFLAAIWIRLSEAPLGFLNQHTRSTVKRIGAALLLLGIAIYLGWDHIPTRSLEVVNGVFIGILVVVILFGLVEIIALSFFHRRHREPTLSQGRVPS